MSPPQLIVAACVAAAKATAKAVIISFFIFIFLFVFFSTLHHAMHLKFYFDIGFLIATVLFLVRLTYQNAPPTGIVSVHATPAVLTHVPLSSSL
jgi:hypothetical protein